MKNWVSPIVRGVLMAVVKRFPRLYSEYESFEQAKFVSWMLETHKFKALPTSNAIPGGLRTRDV